MLVLSQQKDALQFRKLGDPDLLASKITLGTMTFGEQITEMEAHAMLSYAFEQGINISGTAEAYPIPMKKETQGRLDLYIDRWLKSKPRDKAGSLSAGAGLDHPAGGRTFELLEDLT